MFVAKPTKMGLSPLNPRTPRPPCGATPGWPTFCFVDAEQGWAVGDRGAIWHTDDGGRRWTPQDSGVSCSLLGVSLVDRDLGWAVGGFAHPYAHTSSGVVLWTRDGGRHWQHDPNLLLPLLRQVRFTSAKHGWAVGCALAMFPPAAFVTRDGGRNWMPPCGGGGRGWLAGDFLGSTNGRLCRQGRGRHAARRRLAAGGGRRVRPPRRGPPGSYRPPTAGSSATAD